MATSPLNLKFTEGRGDINCPIVFIGYKPSEMDEDKGYVFSDTAGWLLDNMLKESNLPIPYFVTMQPLAKQMLPDEICLTALIQILEKKKYPLIVTCDTRREKGEKLISDVLLHLIPSTGGNIDKYAGSLLTSPLINWPHYILPIASPNYIFEAYHEKDITVSIDLGRLREELTYYLKNDKKLQPLPERELIIEPSAPLLIDFLQDCHKAEYLSKDWETIRPTKGTKVFKKHPGYPYTLSIAPSPKRGISFSMWDYTNEELVKIWRELDFLFKHNKQIYQNGFLFDIVFAEAMGFSPTLELCSDTRIRHHILHPELPHSLQFQTRQYTRQPFYKDEGKHWKPKDKKRLMTYNALDTTVTYEVFLGQELDFDDRPYLR